MKTAGTLVTLIALLAGCTSSSTAVKNEPGVPSTQPSNVTVSASAFDPLWSAADEVSRELFFSPDRQDRRSGTFKTAPMTSSQWFEPWRQELRTPDAVLQSSLATVRRTLTVQVTRDESAGTFTAKPTVLVERYVQAERRITSSARYRQVYNNRAKTYGTTETDAGIVLPETYWYPIGNDPDLERYVAGKMNARIKG